MENVIKYFNTIESSFRKTKIITIASVIGSAVIAIAAVVYAIMTVTTFVSNHSDNIYLVDNNGRAMSATLSSTGIDKELEVMDHVTRFHELMFNLSPSRESINSNLERAFLMCDKSAYDYYNDQNEKGFYERLIQANMVQYISIDSVSVDMSVYPYQEKTYAKLYVLRESNTTMYEFMSQGQLVDMGRSKNNPHGLMLEKFYVPTIEKIETRKRK